MIGNTGIESASPELAKLITITLASMYGFSTRTDGKEIAWEVQEKPNAKGLKTFSETSDEAPFHTDSGYIPEPEDNFVLACVTPAKQGGTNRLVDGWKLAKQIKEIPIFPSFYVTWIGAQYHRSPDNSSRAVLLR